MDLKKKLALALLVGFVSFSAGNAKPIDAPNIKPPVKMQASIYNDRASKYDYTQLTKQYKEITREPRVMEALELMKGTIGEFSRNAILGDNLTAKKMKVEFKDLGQLNQNYANFDALGWKRSGKLTIYINQKHYDAPPAALAALLSHEALHQDELDSLNEETYAWTLEAAVWSQLVDKNPEVANKNHPLVFRENTLKQLFEKGNYTDKYLRKAVFSNPGYQNLPVRSPGYEDENL